MFRSLGARLGFVHFVYFLLLALVVGSTTLVLSQQKDDGLVVNLSGRQRMLTQRITHQLFSYAAAVERGERGSSERQAVLTSMLVFEKTHEALTNGGPAPTDLELVTMREVPAGSVPVKKQMERVGALWKEYRDNARAILDGSVAARETSMLFVGAHNTELLREMNAAVTLMQRESELRVTWLYILQGVALLCGIVVSLLLGVMVRRTVLEPLNELNVASDSMSRGEVHRRLAVRGPREIMELGASFERLRLAMKSLLGSSAASEL